MYVCVCFPNWTGTVAEVKRGQLKKGRWPGGSTEIELAGGLGLWESIRETEFFTSKTAYSLDKRKPCSHATAAHTHTLHIQWLFCLSWDEYPSPLVLLSLRLCYIPRSLHAEHQWSHAFRGKYWQSVWRDGMVPLIICCSYDAWCFCLAAYAPTHPDTHTEARACWSAE